jgi:hypothetical protein
MVAIFRVFRKTFAQALMALPLMLTGCGQGLHSNTYSTTQELDTTLVPEGQKFAVLDTQAITSSLGTSRIVTGRLAAARDFEGSVNFSVNRTALDALGAGSDIIITPVPAQIPLKPGEVKTFSVSVEIRTRSPSFTNSFFQLIATEVTPSADKQIINTQIGLTIQNVYEILLVGGNPPEVWSAPASAAFRSHAAGLRVRFVNMDLTHTHSIQGTGAVPPQTGVMAAATPTSPGGNYEFTIMPAAGAATGTFYCNSHETAGQAHTLQFNQP